MDKADKEFEWFMKEAKKDGIKLKTEDEYRQLYRDLYALANWTFDMWEEKKALEHRLESNPEGFVFEGEGRGCSVCKAGTKVMWFDKYGMRCMNCQNAYKKKILPAYVLTEKGKDKFITDSDLIFKYKISRRVLLKLIKDGQLKVRTVEQGKYQDKLFFLNSQNRNIDKILLPYSKIVQDL